MADPGSGRWAQIRDRKLSTPALREQYERTRDSIITMRRMLQRIDAERERAGLSKSELARRIGAHPATVRRLFTSPTVNPTLKTIIELFMALDLELEVRPRSRIREEHHEPQKADSVPALVAP